MKLSDLIQHKKNLVAWNKPSAKKAAFSTVRSSIPDGEHLFFTLPFGGSSATVAASRTGDAVSFTIVDEDAASRRNRVAGLHISSPVTPGAVPANYSANGLDIPSGVVLIIAGGGRGKTPIAQSLAGMGDNEFEMVRYGEPVAGYHMNETDACRELALKLCEYSTVVVDSVKDILSEASGGAMKSGLQRGALPLFSRLGSIAASLGCTIFTPVNPSSDDDEVIELLTEAAKSNSTSIIIPVGGDKWEMISRTGEGLPRTKTSFTVSYDDNGLAVINGQSNGINEGAVSAVMSKSTKLGYVDYSAAIRRAAVIATESEA